MTRASQSPVYRKVLGSNQKSYGPLIVPVAEPSYKQMTERELAEHSLRSLDQLPKAICAEWRKQFKIEPREIRPFTVFPKPTNPVEVAAGATVVILEYQVAQKYAGFITEFGVYVSPSNYSDVAWTLSINNMPHPEMNQQVILVNSIANRFPFSYELTAGKLIQVTATNNNAGDLDVSAVLCGWTEYLTDMKEYGLNPQGGSI